MRGPWAEQRQRAWERAVAGAQRHRRAYGMLLAFLVVAITVNAAVLLLHVGEGRWWLAARNAVVLAFVTWLGHRYLALVRGEAQPPRYWPRR